LRATLVLKTTVSVPPIKDRVSWVPLREVIEDKRKMFSPGKGNSFPLASVLLSG